MTTKPVKKRTRSSEARQASPLPPEFGTIESMIGVVGDEPDHDVALDLRHDLAWQLGSLTHVGGKEERAARDRGVVRILTAALHAYLKEDAAALERLEAAALTELRRERRDASARWPALALRAPHGRDGLSNPFKPPPPPELVPGYVCVRPGDPYSRDEKRDPHGRARVVSWLASGIAVALENGADAAGVVQLLITSSVPTAKGELHMGVAAAPLAGWGDENPYVPLDVLNAFFEERGKAWRDVSTDRIIRASEKLLRQSIVDAKTIPELSKQLLSRILATIGKDPARALVFDAERKREERGGTPGQLSPQRCNAGRNRAACTLVMHDTSLEEIIARRVAGETLADLRTVRREMRAPGSVRGLIGVRVRAALNRHRRRDAIPPVA